jgi:hypothetical protein
MSLILSQHHRKRGKEMKKILLGVLIGFIVSGLMVAGKVIIAQENQQVSGPLVVAPATSGIPFEWLAECFKLGLLEWIDALTVHPYRPKPPETVMEDYEKLRKLIKNYAPEGKDIPIISGEWGYSLINWDKTQLSEQQQGQYLTRMFLINLYQGIPISIWYDWKDDGTDPNEREHHFGTMTHDLNPKPAYIAANVLAHNLDGFSISERMDLGKSDFIFKLKKSNRGAMAIWTVGEEHKITLPIGKGEGVLIDMMGNEKSVSWDSKGLEVNLSHSPQYLIIE